MRRPLSELREREFQELYALVEFFSTQVKHVASSTASTADVCADIIQRYGRSKALQGLRMAANDIVEDLAHVSAAEAASLDEVFRAAGFITLSELRRRYSSSFKQVVKRGRIRDETEYYLINAVVVDQSSNVDAEERALLQRLLDAYEQSIAPKTQ